MKIQGLKQLDQNSYDSISISEDRAVISGKEIKTVPLMARFSDQLRGKTDKEIQNLIVDQFLDYSRISYVSDDYSRLRGNVVYAGTEPGRLLILNDVADEEMKAKILEKYIKSRRAFLYNNCNNTYSLMINYGKTSSYCITREGTIKFNLSKTGKDLTEFEIPFIEEFLDYVFGSETITMETHENKGIEDGVYLVGNNKRVIAAVINKDIRKKIEEHNERCEKERLERETAMKLQMKMEGF